MRRADSIAGGMGDREPRARRVPVGVFDVVGDLAGRSAANRRDCQRADEPFAEQEAAILGQGNAAGARGQHVAARRVVERSRCRAVSEVDAPDVERLPLARFAINDRLPGRREPRPANASAPEGELLECRRRLRPQQQEGDGRRLGDEHGGDQRRARPAADDGRRLERARRRGRITQLLQGEGEVAGRLETFFPVLFQAAEHDCRRRGRQSRIDGARVGRIVLQHRRHRLHRRRTVEGARAGEHLVEHGAERKDVGTVIHGRAENLFGRHVARGAADLPGTRLVDRVRLRFGAPLLLAQLGDAEIQQFHPPVAGDERVRRFDVAMPDAAPVRRVECLGDLHAVLDRLSIRDRPPVEACAQRFSFEHLGHEVGDSLRRTDVEHRNDVGMIQAAGGAGFAAEPRDALRVVGRAAEDLDGDVPAQPGIVRAIHFAHPSGAEQLDDLIRTKPAARRDGQRGLRRRGDRVSHCSPRLVAVVPARGCRLLAEPEDSACRHPPEAYLATRREHIVDLRIRTRCAYFAC